MRPLEWLSQLFHVPSLEERLAKTAAKLRFGFPPDCEGYYQLMEVDLAKLIAGQEHMVANIRAHKASETGKKFINLERDIVASEGMMLMPRIHFGGEYAAINDGRHRIGMLVAMGVKVIPVVVHGVQNAEVFLEKYGVGKTYYRELPDQYYISRHGSTIQKPDSIRGFAPVNREEIMQPPVPYQKRAEKQPSATAHLDNLTKGTDREHGRRKIFPKSAYEGRE